MLENGLFFALGLLCATLFALLIAPAIWRRAVFLTTKQIQDSVPLSLDEIQASKDQLRARYAIKTRKLEIDLEKSTEQSAVHLIELNRKRDQLLQHKNIESSKDARLSELENHIVQLGSDLQMREERLAATEARLVSIEQQLKEKSGALEEMKLKFRSAVDEFAGQKIEIVAHETRMDTVLDVSRQLKNSAKQLSNNKIKAEKERKAALIALDKAHTRNSELDTKLANLTASLADVEGRLERRNADLKKLQKKSPTGGNNRTSDDEQKIGNEIIQQRISDLAARVTAMVATTQRA